MIFVTVGAQMPFDRLVRTIDQWAGSNPGNDVYAQIGLSEYRPSNIDWVPLLAPEAFRRKFESAKVIVAHAGTGTIITALQLGKPILIMPRRALLQETRNDHQVATSEQFRRFDSVEVAWDENELVTKLADIDNLQGAKVLDTSASKELVGAIKEFIDNTDQR